MTWGWDVPGYRIGRLLGFGQLGEVWEATRVDTGQPVVLRRLTGFDPDEVAHALRPLPALAGPHVVRLLDLHEVDGDVVLVLQRAAGQLRGPLSASQVVTALAPVAQVLASAHEAGIRHGRLTVGEVLLDASGRPLLDGLGITSLLDHEVDDCQALVQITRDLVDQPGPLADVLALDWADVGAFGRALLAACPAQPLVGTARQEPAPPRPRPVRGLLVAAVAVLLVSGVVAQRLATAPEAADGDWTQVLTDLDRARAAAFDAGDTRLLAQAYVPGSPALAADTARLRALAAAHQRTKGLHHELVDVRTVQTTPERVELDVRMLLAAYDLVGARPQHVPAGPVVVRTVLLQRTPEGWRVGAIT